MGSLEATAFAGAGAGLSKPRVRSWPSASSSSSILRASGRDFTLRYLQKNTEERDFNPQGQQDPVSHPGLGPGGHSPLQQAVEILLHPQLLVPERGREAQPVLCLTVGSVQIRVHMQSVGAGAGGVGLEKRGGVESQHIPKTTL